MSEEDHRHDSERQGAARRAVGEPGQADESSLTLGDLTDAAGVSVRTVRYYIAEGLLPPPHGAGPASVYSPGHLDRLRLIQRLKAAYFPLKEIRRRLAGLDDSEVRTLLAGAETTADDFAPERPADAALAGARDYLTMLESPARYRAEPLTLPFAAPPAAASPGSALRAAAQPMPGAADDAPASRPEDAAAGAPTPELPLWRRLPLGDEAELVISERVYARHRERVDWLVRWARKVFG